MKHRLLLSSLALLLVPLLGFAQSANPAAEDEIRKGARSYRAGNFAQARRHFERALEIDPTHERAPLYVARSIQQQYKPGVDTPENVAVAREAISAYLAVLVRDPNNDDVYRAVAYLYGAIGDEAQQAEWLERRASREDLPWEKRADAYTALAKKKWDCSAKVTEKGDNRQTVTEDGGTGIRYVMPKEEGAFTGAQQCVEQGLELIERAIGLNPQSEAAWSQKMNLLREKAKLAEMGGQTEEKARASQLADEAQRRKDQLSESKGGKRQP